jgi:Ca2+-binding EF-hand superfamily protein
MTKTLTASIALLALVATPLFAETVVEDTDGNGTYSLEELVAAYPDLTEELFAEIDTDESGEVSAEELKAAVDAGIIAG